MNKKNATVVGLALVVCIAIAGGAWWWVQQQTPGGQIPKAPTLDAQQPSYVSLDKVLVMLREPSLPNTNRYLSLDLVFRTDKPHEKAVKANLPMLKGVALRRLSKLELAQAQAMSIEEWTEMLNREMLAAYEGNLALRGFDQVMVSRLILE